MESKINETERPIVPLTFAGKTYEVRLSLGAISTIQKEFGSINAALDDCEQIFSLTKIVAALINDAIEVEAFENGEKCQKLTPEYIMAKSTDQDLPSFSAAVLAAFGASLPESNEIDGDDEDIDDSDVPESDEKNIAAE